MKSLFLPSGLLCSFIFAWFLPFPGTLLNEVGLMPWTIVLIFLVNGYQTQLHELPRDRHFLYALISAGVITLGLAPFMGAALAGWFGFGAGMALGLIVKATVPSTLSTCIVMTQLAGGNSLWALMMTVALNIIGVFTIPFILSSILAESGAITLSPWELLIQLILLVLLPFLAGLIARRMLSIAPDHFLLQYLPSSCIIFAVLMALSSSNEVLKELDLTTLIQIIAVTLILHFSLMALGAIAAKLVNTPTEGSVALLMVSSQKTLPVAVSVLASLNQPIGEAILICVLFHFIQLFSDSLVLPWLKRCYPTQSEKV